MQARCPHCAQVFPTDRPGLQHCPSCGQQINVPPQGPSSVPPSGLPPQASPPVQREDTPWERRAELGLMQGFWQTWKRSMLSPDAFWSSVRAVLSLPITLLNIGSAQSQLAQLSDKLDKLPPEVLTLVEGLLANAPQLALVGMVMSVLFYPLGFLINAGVIHLFCLIWGANKNGFNATARVIGYSAGPLALGWVPVVGGLVGLYVVVECWGIMKVQETTPARAIGAVLTLFGLVICCACGGAIFAMTLAMKSTQ